MNTEPPPTKEEIAKRFNSKEQASQYAKQNGHDRYKPYKITTGFFVLRSLFHPVCFIE